MLLSNIHCMRNSALNADCKSQYLFIISSGIFKMSVSPSSAAPWTLIFKACCWVTTMTAALQGGDRMASLAFVTASCSGTAWCLKPCSILWIKCRPRLYYQERNTGRSSTLLLYLRAGYLTLFERRDNASAVYKEFRKFDDLLTKLARGSIKRGKLHNSEWQSSCSTFAFPSDFMCVQYSMYEMMLGLHQGKPKQPTHAGFDCGSCCPQTVWT